MMTKKLIIIALGIISLIGLILGVKHFAVPAEPKIVKAKDNALYTSQNTPFEAEFGRKDNPTQIVFKYQDASLLFQLPKGQIDWRTEPEKLMAEMEDKSFSYSILKDEKGKALGIKEEIILKKPIDQNWFEFSLSLKGLSAKKENGLWHFYNQEGKKLFFIPKPFMVDANGIKSEEVEIRIEKDKIMITADQEWLLAPERKYPISIDPSLQLTILTVHSHPQQGENWEVNFETEGKADLKIIPNDQATIDDDEFRGLYCGDKKITPQILANEVIFVKNWQCGQTAKVIHYTKKAGKHTLRFEFGGQTAYAYNSLGSTTYNFVDVTQATNDYYAYEDYGTSVFSGPDDTGTSEATNTDYDNIESDNGTRWESANASADGDYDAQLYKFYITESESTISQLDLKWNGYGETESGYLTYFYIWDYNASAWEQLDSKDFTAATDANLTGAISANPGNYIDTDGEVTLMVKTKRGFRCGTDTITYGGETYPTVEIGDQCWLGKNLNITPSSADNSNCSGTKYCYNNSSSNCTTYGGLYIWYDAMCGASSSSSDPSGVQGLCPDGWHLPSDDELTDLENNLTCGDGGDEGSALAGNASLWTDGALESDDDFGCSGFNLLPAGNLDTRGRYRSLGSGASLWSSTDSDAVYAWFRRVYYNYTTIILGSHEKYYGFSVRCLRD